jgi:small subunit ribosomal protein S6
MRKYEIGVILHPDLEIDLENATNKVERIIESAQGKIEKKDNWGKRKLAYRINNQDWGIYIFYEVKIPPEKVAQIDSSLKITEEVIRYLIVSLENIKRVSKADKPAKDETKKKESK